jgi:hypothetical protein
MKDGPTTSGQAAFDEALAQLGGPGGRPVCVNTFESDRAAEDAFSVNYAAWLAADRPMHEFSPLTVGATACGTCGRQADDQAHPVGMTLAEALAALDARPRTGPGTGLSATIQPVELVPLRQLARAVRWEQQQDRAGRALAALEGQPWPGDYAAACEQLRTVTAILSGATS